MLLQFAFFETGFFCVLLLQFLFYYGSRHNWKDFAYAMDNVFMHCGANLLPNSFMLYSHHLLFSKQLSVHQKEEQPAAASYSPRIQSTGDTSAAQ